MAENERLYTIPLGCSSASWISSTSVLSAVRGQFARISATETSLTLVPVGPVRIRPPHFWRAW